ncbi:TPA: hypothetical protein QFV83_000683 [Klebsiella aerogenes]|nr:hypothetical protein [Klebsiella aerogenes]
MKGQSNLLPGYCIVQQPGTLDFQARLLFNNINCESARYFMQLNRDTPWVKPGQILIIADPNNLNHAFQMNSLFVAKKKVNTALSTVDNSVAEMLNKNYDKISTITSWGDAIVGNASDSGEKYFRQIESILKKIEATYQNQFRTQGALIGQQFYAERNALFTQLKPLLNKVVRKSLKFNDYNDMKRVLGLSTQSIVHEWSTVGIGAIPGYATYVNSAAKAAAFMKMGGWVAFGLSFMNTSNDVYHACTAGRESECGQVAIKKYSEFAGGIGGGMAGASFAAPICIAAGVPTYGVGTIVCGLVVTAAGSWAGSIVGDEIGNTLNRLIYRGD